MTRFAASRFAAIDIAMLVTYPEQPVRAAQAVRAGRRPAGGDRRSSIEGLERRPRRSRRCSASPARARPTRWPTSSRSTGRPALVLAPNKTLAAQLYSEFREFFPNNAVEYFVSYYDYYQPEAYVPSRDLYIEKDSSINEHIEQMRLSATKAILERPDCVIVATVSAIYGIGDPSEYHSMILHVQEGDTLTQRDAIKRLTEMQYTRNEADFRRGTFRVRGDVLDIFPAEHAENAVRVSLFDDEVESLQLFDPLTGHIKQQIGALHRVPVVALRDRAGRRCSTRSRRSRSSSRSRRSSSSAQMKLIEAQRIEQRTRFDLEMMTEIGFCKGIENYSRHLSGRNAGRAAADADRLPAARLADVRRREPRDDPAGRRHVQGRPRAQGEPRQLRLPAAVGARQPAAALRRVRAAAAADDLRLGDAGRLRADARRAGRRAGGAADRARRSGARRAPGADAGRRPAVGDQAARRAATSACW